MAIEIPRPAKNRLAVARRYSRDPRTRPSVELDLVITACAGIPFTVVVDTNAAAPSNVCPST
jgi:hypothetical protein